MQCHSELQIIKIWRVLPLRPSYYSLQVPCDCSFTCRYGDSSFLVELFYMELTKTIFANFRQHFVCLLKSPPTYIKSYIYTSTIIWVNIKLNALGLCNAGSLFLTTSHVFFKTLICLWLFVFLKRKILRRNVLFFQYIN